MMIDGKAMAYGKDFEKNVGNAKFSIFLLWLLSKKKMHGYEIMKVLQDDSMMPCRPASKIYPLLRSLSKKGLISHSKEMQGKRARKVYCITDKGKATLKKAKEFFKRSSLATQYMEDMLR